MAVTVTPITTGINNTVFDVIATADADTTATCTHNQNSTGVWIMLVPLLDAAHTSRWIVSSITATTIVLTKGIGVGSGNAGAQLRVFVLPYTAGYPLVSGNR